MPASTSAARIARSPRARRAVAVAAASSVTQHQAAEANAGDQERGGVVRPYPPLAAAKIAAQDSSRS